MCAVGPCRETQEDDNDFKEMKQEEEGDVEEDENGDYVVVAGTLAQEILWKKYFLEITKHTRNN